MTRSEVHRLVIQAGGRIHHDNWVLKAEWDDDALMRFVALIEEHERARIEEEQQRCYVARNP